MPQVSSVLEPPVHSAAETAGDERRNHPRLSRDELPWIRDARLVRGPRVELVDISPGGALVETHAQLKPGTSHTLEIVGERVGTIPVRVVRCQVAAIAGTGAVYRGGFEFKHLLDVNTALRAGQTAPAVLLQQLNPQPRTESAVTTGWQKIVVRYREGLLLKGFTHDFHPSRAHFSLWPTLNASSTERVVIPFSRLKAVFFVRDFDGNPRYTDSRTLSRRLNGRVIEVTFQDNEVLVGSTLSYRPDRIGFFVLPADEGTNNQRVFVVANAVRHVRFP